MNGLAEIGEFMNILYEQKGELDKKLCEFKALEEEINRLGHDSRHSVIAMKKWQKLEQLLRSEDWLKWQRQLIEVTGKIRTHLGTVNSGIEQLSARAEHAGPVSMAVQSGIKSKNATRRFV